MKTVPKKNENNRNYGIDALRILLMYMIVLGHLYAHTNIRNAVDFLSLKWISIWVPQSITVCAVNAFIIITGYFQWKKAYNLNKILQLWGKVLFYSILLFIVIIIVDKKMLSTNNVLNAFFPVLRQEYWFFSSYIIMILFSPLINVALNNITIHDHKKIVILITAIFYILPLMSILFPEIDPKSGYGIIGFTTLYIIGAYLNRSKFKIHPKNGIIILIINSIIILSSKIVITLINANMGTNFGTSLFYHYNTIFQLINAIILVGIFIDITPSKKIQKTIKKISPIVFSVYLIHDNPLVRDLLWKTTIGYNLVKMNDCEFIVCLILLPIIVYIVCLILGRIFDYTYAKIINLVFDKRRIKIKDEKI